MQEKYFSPGVKLKEIETPALIVDMDLMEKNIERMADHFANIKANLRPHFKAHKSVFLARKQIKAGAVGITCAKLGEAELLIKNGIDNVLIANQITSKSKIERLAFLCRYGNVIVGVDNLSNLRDLSEVAFSLQVTIGVLIEIDVGLNRCGVRTIEEAVHLAKEAIKLPGINFKGIMGYEGHCNKYIDKKTRAEETAKANSLLSKAKQEMLNLGIHVEIVSAGGTAMYDIAPLNIDVTEIQAGAYILMGLKWSELEGIPFKQALTILARVVSRPSEDIVIIDAGHKAYTTESGLPVVRGLGDTIISKVSEEHTTLSIHNTKCDLSLGHTVELIPSNCCTTANLYDYYYGVRGGIFESVINIDARGRFD